MGGYIVLSEYCRVCGGHLIKNDRGIECGELSCDSDNGLSFIAALEAAEKVREEK